MIRRKRTTASGYPGQALPKGPTRFELKARKDLAEHARIYAVRDYILARARGRCECCGRLMAGVPFEMHECWPRNETMRMPPERRFDARWCMAVCHACHVNLTPHALGGKRWKTVFGSLRGAEAIVKFLDRAGNLLFDRCVKGECDEQDLSAYEVWQAADGTPAIPPMR